MSVKQDETLVREVLSGDIESYSVLVHRYTGRLLYYVQGKIRDFAAAEDIVQEAFLRAYEGLAKCTKPEGFSLWLFEIVRNCLREWLRERQHFKDVLDKLSQDEMMPQSVSTELEKYGDALEQSLAKLPKNFQKMLIMKYEQGMSCNEIAQVLSSPINTVTKQLSRAYKELEILMKQYLEEHK